VKENHRCFEHSTAAKADYVNAWSTSLRLNVAAGCIVGTIIFLGLVSLAPDAACVDGWRSPSIGRRGACSYHGGVDRHELLTLIIVGISVASGVFTSKILARNTKSSPSQRLTGAAEPFSFEVKLIMTAIEKQNKLEFLYKKPGAAGYEQRTVRPIELDRVAHKRGNGYTLCIRGYCELRRDIRNFAIKRMKNLRVI